MFIHADICVCEGGRGSVFVCVCVCVYMRACVCVRVCDVFVAVAAISLFISSTQYLPAKCSLFSKA